MALDETEFYFAELRAALQSRMIPAPLPLALRPWQCVFLSSGSLEISAENTASQFAGEAEQRRFDAPCIVCWPFDAPRSVRVLAGSAGVHIAVGDGLILQALGARPEASELRELARGFVALGLGPMPKQQARIVAALTEIARESGAGAAGQLLVIEAQLRCLLIYLLRHTERSEDSATRGPQAVMLRRFRRLVETHFRARWQVGDYARELNTTTDRLHNICTQVLGRAPLALIHERAHREACALLTRTHLSLDQIAAQLGYKSPPQFSAFFRKCEGLPPGKYRTRARSRKAEDAPTEVDFADWP